MKRKLSYVNVILLLFLGGVIAGTILANCLNRELMEQSGYFGTLFSTQVTLNRGQQRELLFYVFRQRILEIAAAWLISMTMYSAFLFAGLSFAFGGMTGIVISMITYQKGVWGLFYYLATIFPQMICYLPVWIILMIWAGQSEKNYRWRSLAKIIVLVLLGIFLEACINPYIIGYLIK